MTLDLMTMTCISRLFPTEGLMRSRHSSSINALDVMFRKKSREDMSVVMNRLLSSLHRVLVADDFSRRDPKLSRFISQIGLPNLMLELNDSHSDQYWAYRIQNRVPHSAAFRNIGLRVGDFPVKLSPLRKSPEEYSIIKTGYYRGMMKVMREVVEKCAMEDAEGMEITGNLEDTESTEDTEVAKGTEGTVGTEVMKII